MQLCCACLSSDRNLTVLKDIQQINPITKLLNLNFNLTEDHICWECEARFKSIHVFRTQVLKARKMLKIWQRSKTKKILMPLSNLSCNIKNCYDEIFTRQVMDEINGENMDDSELDVDIIDDLNGEEAIEQIDELNAVYIVDNCKADDIQVSGMEPSLSQDGTTHLQNGSALKLSKEEEQFIVTRMNIDELYETRDIDRNGTVYKRCPFKCTKCVVGYYQDNKYKRHLKEKHEAVSGNKKRIHICSICETYFTRRDALETHYERHFRRYKCRECDFCHHKLASMLAHKISKHNDGQRYSCDICNKEFERLRTLRAHKDTHKERPKCDICGKTASTKSNLKIHMLVHTGVTRVQCPECGRSVRRSSLGAHRRTHRPRPEAAFCAECGVQFAAVALYRRHLRQSRKHASPRRIEFPCTECQSKFSDKFTLTRHVAAKHLNIYPFKCHICNKGFIRKDRVKNHILERHEGISRPKDKICTYCDKGFKDRASLERHIRVHSGARPYACRRCGAGFAQSGTRNKHEQAHHALTE